MSHNASTRAAKVARVLVPQWKDNKMARGPLPGHELDIQCVEHRPDRVDQRREF
jgi:hypothetical protein